MPVRNTYAASIFFLCARSSLLFMDARSGRCAGLVSLFSFHFLRWQSPGAIFPENICDARGVHRALSRLVGFRSSTRRQNSSTFFTSHRNALKKNGEGWLSSAMSMLCKRIDLLSDTSNLIFLRASNRFVSFCISNLEILIASWITRPLAIHGRIDADYNE